MDNNTFNILSICSGVGGLELGLQLVVPNSRTIAYVEGEAYACAVLAERMAEGALDSAPVWTDLRTFDGKPFRGKVDCIVGGYPCQPFSVAGKQLGANDERHLWPVVAAIIADVQPPICFFENVRGHLQLEFEQVATDLQRMGYCVKAGLFSAAECGATHNRERLFILAYRNDDGRTGRRNNNDERSILSDKKWQSATAHQDGMVAQFGAGKNSPLVANCSGFGGQWCKFCRGREWKCQKTTDKRSCALAAFPPAPFDTDGWKNISDNLKPTILRMADGLANRVDRIRACGNGVVPLVAAYAWRTLTANLELMWDKD